jgi:DNA-directed RNA polymerase subunit RPC12/RpoP
MDFFKGQKLKLKFDSFDPSSEDKNSVLFPAGTEVTIKDISGDNAAIQFPDDVYLHRIQDLPLLFQSLSKPVLTKIFKGAGTPPKALFPFMPNDAKWEHNYLYTITVTLQDEGRKSYLCQDCYTELPGTDITLIRGIECPQCKEIKIPLAVDSIVPAESHASHM